MEMFTSENNIQSMKDKKERERQEKIDLNTPLFENPRESIRSFTESLQAQKSVLADVLKRQSNRKKENTTSSHPRL